MVPVAGLARVFPDTTRRRPALAGQQRAARRRGHKRRERLSRQERLHKHAAADQAIHGLREDHATAAGEVVDEAMQVGGLGPHVKLLAHKVGEVVGRLGKRQPPNAVELRARGEESCSTLPLRATPPPLAGPFTIALWGRAHRRAHLHHLSRRANQPEVRRHVVLHSGVKHFDR